MRILLSVGLLALTLTACGSPVSESNRPRADEGSCSRVDGQTRCNDNISSSKSPGEKSAF